MSNFYSRELILENYHQPANRKQLANATGIAELANVTCGDEIKAYVNIKEDKVAELSYEITGCALAIATASILSQELVGKTTAQLAELDIPFLEETLGDKLSINRVKCALLALRGFQQAAGVREKTAAF